MVGKHIARHAGPRVTGPNSQPSCAARGRGCDPPMSDWRPGRAGARPACGGRRSPNSRACRSTTTSGWNRAGDRDRRGRWSARSAAHCASPVTSVTYLHHLLGESPAPPAGPDRRVRPGLLHLLDRMADTPVVVCAADYDVLAWNALGAALLVGIADHSPTDRNVALRLFTTPARARATTPTTRRPSRANASRGCAAAPPATRRPRVQSSSGDCARQRGIPRALGASRTSTWRRSNRKRLQHPMVGWLDLDCQALLDPVADQWVIMYTATPGTPSHEALKLLKVIGTQDLVPRD